MISSDALDQSLADALEADPDADDAAQQLADDERFSEWERGQEALNFLVDIGEESIRPDPAWTVSEWADRHRVLSSVASAEPGIWRTTRTPFLREIMDNCSAYDPTERTVVMKGAQLGVSEGALNFMGYAIHHSPGPALYVMPTVETVKKLSKTRLDPMIEGSPALSERVPPPRAKDGSNTVFSKDYPGGVLILTGANSAAGLRSMPIRFLALDEVDAYPASADDEGDPVMLALKRTANFIRRKILMLSTPGVKGYSRIGKAFREGDQRYYHVRCERCGLEQPIKWAQIKWEPGRPETAGFVCGWTDKETGEVHGCGHKHGEHRKAHLMAEANGARWIPTAVATRPRLRSYHLSSLYSPWQTWEEIVREFLDAKDDPALLQPFVNTVLGEEWEDTGDKVDPDSLLARREDYTDPPPWVTILTAGVDVQPDRLEVEVVGWGRDEESWSIECRIIDGDPTQPEVWERLDDLLMRRWDHPAYKNGVGILAACIDTGGANTQDAYRFVKPREGRRVWGIKGYDGKRPVWPKKPSRNNKGKINLYSIGVDSAKETVMARLNRTGEKYSGAGACHFNQEWDQEMFGQLTAESKRTKYVKGFPVVHWWKPEKARNERLDCRVYAYAALQGLILEGFHLNRESRRIADTLGLSRTRPALETDQDQSVTEGEADAAIPSNALPDGPRREKPKRKARPKRRGMSVASPYM